MVADTKVYDEYIPPGTLVSYLQKALQYVEMETHVCTVYLSDLLCYCVGWNRD